MANPYGVYVAGQDGSINQGLSGVFGALQRKNEMVTQQEKQQQAIDAQNALNAQASEVFQSGTPEEISSFMIANPSAQNQIISADKFLNERTKDSKLNAARDIAMGVDPQQALGRSAQEIQAEGGDPKDTINMANQPPEVQKAASEKLWASMDPQGYKAWKGAQPKPESNKGTFQFKETPSGFAKLNTATGEMEEMPLSSVETANAKKVTDAKFKEDLKQSKDKFEVADKIVKRYDKLSDSFYKTREAYDRIQASEVTAPGDIAMIFNYMKMLDPGSVVREGEFATAQNATGVDDRVMNQYNKLLSGERLNPTQRKQFISQAESIYKKANEQQKKYKKEAIARGKQYNISEQDIFGQKEAANLSDEDLLKKYGG